MVLLGYGDLLIKIIFFGKYKKLTSEKILIKTEMKEINNLNNLNKIQCSWAVRKSNIHYTILTFIVFEETDNVEFLANSTRPK